jgi:hypothetical protein
MYLALSVIGICPSVLTEVGPEDVLDDRPMFG